MFELCSYFCFSVSDASRHQSCFTCLNTSLDHDLMSQVDLSFYSDVYVYFVVVYTLPHLNENDIHTIK